MVNLHVHRNYTVPGSSIVYITVISVTECHLLSVAYTRYDLARKVVEQLWFQADIALAELMVVCKDNNYIYKLPFNIVIFYIF